MTGTYLPLITLLPSTPSRVCGCAGVQGLAAWCKDTSGTFPITANGIPYAFITIPEFVVSSR